MERKFQFTPVRLVESGVALGVKGIHQSDKKAKTTVGPLVSAFHGYSEQLITSNATHASERSNDFYNRSSKAPSKGITGRFDSSRHETMNPAKELSYVPNTQVHGKRISVVRSKCPPTNEKQTYSKLYALKSLDYVRNPYGGPKHAESRLKLIN